MIRINGKSLWMAMFLAGTGVYASMVAGQQGFVDDSSHVPPSPAAYNSVPRGTFVPGAVPNPSVTRPVPATSATTGDFGYSRPPARLNHASGATGKARVSPYGGQRPAPSQTSNSTSPGVNSPRHVTPLGQASTTGTISQAGHLDNAVEFGFSSPPPGQLPDSGPFLNFNPSPPPAPGMNFPSERIGAPQITGSRIGLLPGETATERSVRLMLHIGELENRLNAAEQRNGELLALTRQRDEQLQLAIREIKSARKEVTSARDELEHLRSQVKALQDKVHDAERDNAALLKTMAPLLQKLVESDGPNVPADEPQD